MRAAMFTETGGPLTIENVEPDAARTAGRRRPARRERRLPLRPVAQERLRRHHARHDPRPRGRGHGRRGRQGGHQGQAGRPDHRLVHPGLRRAAGSACTTSRTCATPSSNVMMAHARQPHRRQPVHGDDRPRHVRRGDDVQRPVDREGRHERPRRPARADRLRRHHRRGRGAQHRRGRSPARPSRSSAAAVSARPSSRARASPARRASSRSTRSR